MPNDKHRQLVGAMGDWLDAATDEVSAADRSRASKLILGGSLLGVGINEADSSEVAGLAKADRELVRRVREWAGAEPSAPSTATSAPGAKKKKNSKPKPSDTAPASVIDKDHADDPPPSKKASKSEADVDGASESASAASDKTTFALLVDEPELSDTAQPDSDQVQPSTSRTLLREEVLLWAICYLALAVIAIRLLI